MKKSSVILVCLFLMSVVVLILPGCTKEEIEIVYSKITTVGVSGTTSTSTNVEGNIVELTAATHSEYGIAWDTLANPTIYINKVLADGTPATGSFTVYLSGLKPSKTYHVRAFVKDNKKYIYGADVSFTTSAAALPVVTTASASGITSAYASSGGNVTSQGDRPVIAKGICYDTIANPTILKNKTMDGWGTGSFTSRLINLKPSKQYYVRAYAISEFGISYGSQVTFTTKARLYSFREDFDDNSNEWYTGTFSNGSAEITGGKYKMSFSQEGYLWRSYNNITGFASVANSGDFEISTNMEILVYPLAYSYAEAIAAIVWDCSSTNFKYFGIKKNLGPNPGRSTPTYKYTAGSYSGSYTVWKDFTDFSGSEVNSISIKKAGGSYYFFINDVQVFKRSYSNISNDGVGFYCEDATLYAGYLYLDQKGEKKSGNYDLIRMVTGSAGLNDLVRSFNNK